MIDFFIEHRELLTSIGLWILGILAFVNYACNRNIP